MIVSFKVCDLCMYIQCGEMMGSSAGRLVQDMHDIPAMGRGRPAALAMGEKSKKSTKSSGLLVKHLTTASSPL